MSKYAFRPRGGQEGIQVTQTELSRFASFLGKNYIDEVIPLPNVSPGDQKARLNTCIKNHATMESAEYWEDNKGSHGWCCSHCGETLQWG
jgi:hypothetical protein